MTIAITSAYLALSLLVAAFALRELRLLLRYLRYREAIEARQLELAAPAPADAARPAVPRVTVQIPLYNERGVAERAIRAAAALDYPRDALEIQVLDDSTDETSALVASVVRELSAQGLAISHLRRGHRHGYKAGALAEGLSRASGELVAIFDADFVPPSYFLRRLLVELQVFADPEVGYAQARWDFPERDRSRLLRVQSVLLDRHFFVEKPTVLHMRTVTSFNGSAGVWRKQAIEDAGGWSSDTLTEDLDLSFRASFRGWRGLYVRDVASPSDLPRDMLAFKLQQRRWARGSAQCLRKLAGPIQRSSMPLSQRVYELLTISGYAIHPLMLGTLLLWPWAVVYTEPRALFLVAQALGSFGLLVAPLGFYLAARARGRSVDRALVEELVLAIAVGLGFMVSNAAAYLSGLWLRDGGEFQRTPKHEERAPLHWTLYAELVVAAYAFASGALLLQLGEWMWMGPSLLWGACLTVMIGLQLQALGEAARRERPQVAPTEAA